jgi:hypothetical protein
VIDIAGEASVQMTMQEMSTAVQYDLPIKIFILNNQYMGMVRQWQELLHGNRAIRIPIPRRCPISSSSPRPITLRRHPLRSSRASSTARSGDDRGQEAGAVRLPGRSGWRTASR